MQKNILQILSILILAFINPINCNADHLTALLTSETCYFYIIYLIILDRDFWIPHGSAIAYSQKVKLVPPMSNRKSLIELK